MPPTPFRGSHTWIHQWEGHRGAPYWPGGASGVTLDPGFDLAHQTEATLRARYAFLSPADLDALAGVLGLRGQSARAAVGTLPPISISSDQAERAFPAVAAPYWQGISERFRALRDAPGPVHTALLSIAYNRGVQNTGLACLSPPIDRRDWLRVGILIAGMQQGHQLDGIRARRRAEGELIRVWWVQDRLIVHGSRIVADGIMGPRTREAIRTFQLRCGIPVTGQVESETLAALRR